MKRRTEITIETERLLVRRRRAGGGCARPLCPSCTQDAEMISEDEAAVLLRVTPEELRRSARAGEIHALRTSGGELLLCLDSLLRSEGRVVELRTDDGRIYQP